jgi:hypothetical protein
LLKQEAAAVAGFNWFKHRTGSIRCQTSLFAYHPQLPRGRTGEATEKAVPEASEVFLFPSSTDPVAKERFFLERFTCFQQG